MTAEIEVDTSPVLTSVTSLRVDVVYAGFENLGSMLKMTEYLTGGRKGSKLHGLWYDTETTGLGSTYVYDRYPLSVEFSTARSGGAPMADTKKATTLQEQSNLQSVVSCYTIGPSDRSTRDRMIASVRFVRIRNTEPQRPVSAVSCRLGPRENGKDELVLTAETKLGKSTFNPWE